METVWLRIKNDIKEYRMALLVCGIYYAVMRVCFHAFCPLVIVTGLPCPGCGLSRACLLLLGGEFFRSFRMHPLAVFWIFWVLYAAGNRYLCGRKVSRRMQRALMVLALATLILYVVRMLLYFPQRPPMAYTGGNLFEKFIPNYRSRITGWRRF